MVISAELESEVSQLLVAAGDGEKLVAVVQQVMSLLEKNKHVHKLRVPPHLVGCHPSNRDGLGLSAPDVADLLQSILQVGYVASRVFAVAAEVDSDYVRTWNEQLVQSAQGQLGIMDGSMLKIVSLCGSHTNFSLRILLDGVPHSYEPATVDGKLNLARVQELDPGLAQAAREGLPWQIISAEVATRWPEFLHMVQSAGNALLTKAESEMQLLRRIHTMSTRMEAAGSLEFQKVKKLALASKPPCSACVPHLYKFALQFCGGASAPMLAESEMFLRSRASSARSLGADMWEALVTTSKARDCRVLAYVRHAFVKIAMTTKNIVTTTDCKRLGSKELAQKAGECDALLAEARQWVQANFAHHCTDPFMITALGMLDMNAVAHVLNLRLPGEKKVKTVQAVAHDFARIVLAMTGAQGACSPWESFAEQDDSQQSQSSSSQPNTMRTVTPS